MVDLRILKANKCTAEDWRKIFEGRDRAHMLVRKDQRDPTIIKKPKKQKSKTDKIDELMERIYNRICNGREWNFQNYQIAYAMDLIWDAPFRQVNPTMIAAVCEQHGKNTEEVKSIMKGLGLDFDAILKTSKDPKSGKEITTIDVPTFFAVTVPLVRSYHTVRRARIINDRNRDPFIQYKAATQTKENRTRCEVLTSRVQQTAKHYDYLGALNQMVFQMLLYPSGCLAFTKEEWHKSEQLRYKKDGKETEQYTVREGLRYHIPHPTRTFWDQAHPLRTFNTDTGCSYAGYWQVMRYGDIEDNKGFYNTDRITVGDTGWFTGGSQFWRLVYSSCTVKVPTITVPDTAPDAMDREQYILDNPYYNGDMRDHSVMLCEYREKLNPKQWGLGDYDHDVWCRFVVAGDGTIVYAAPMGYTPVVPCRDNGDDKRMGDASLALQLAPFQDQLSNLLTQFLLTVKQNLANFTLVDKSTVDTDSLKKMLNEGETYFRGLNIQTFDSRQMRVLQVDPKGAVIPHRFPPLDTNGIVLAMKLVIDMAERVLQFSSQEIAQAASHEQTKAEVEKIHATTTNILEFTCIPVDQAMDSMAQQNYEAVMNYGEDEFYAQIPSDHEIDEKRLEALGITQDEDGETLDKKIKVKAKKRPALELDSFATVPPNSKRQTNWEASQAMGQFVQVLASNQQLAMAIGPQQFIDLANEIATLAGIELPAPLRNVTEETQKQMASDLLKQTVDAVLGIVRTETKQGMEVVLQKVAQNDQLLKTIADKLLAVYRALGLDAPQAPNPPPDPLGGIGPEGMAQPALGGGVPPPAPVPGPAGLF